MKSAFVILALTFSCLSSAFADNCPNIDEYNENAPSPSVDRVMDFVRCAAAMAYVRGLNLTNDKSTPKVYYTPVKVNREEYVVDYSYKVTVRRHFGIDPPIGGECDYTVHMTSKGLIGFGTVHCPD